MQTKIIYYIGRCLILFTFFNFFAAQSYCSPDSHNYLTKKGQKKNKIQVVYPEVYELANVILALTQYGRDDRWQINKNSFYYNEVIEYFEPMFQHPLIDSVNFSSNRWEEFLSFRTDAFAFSFNAKGKISRTMNFQSFDDIMIFDKFLPLVQDFSEKSGFREFFCKHSLSYQKIIDGYNSEYLIEEMRHFLFKEVIPCCQNQKFYVVISALVGSQNLHRKVSNSSSADFVPIAQPIIEGNRFESNFRRAIEIHTLFTEMSHAYVNVLSDKYGDLIVNNFHENLWDVSSGYAGYNLAVFDEYLTWSLYDIFIAEIFPIVSDTVSLYWHYQNDSRGFQYSHYFSQELKKLYFQATKSDGKIESLIIPFLEWCSMQNQITKPQLVFPKSPVEYTSGVNHFNLKFSEPLCPVKEFNILVETDEGTIDTLLINKDNQLIWSDNNTMCSFECYLPMSPKLFLVTNWWGVSHPLISEKGILVKSNSYFKLVLSKHEN